jgi:uncharacterized protein (UPF0305 family)
MDELLASLRVAAQQYVQAELRKMAIQAEVAALMMKINELEPQKTDAEAAFAGAETAFGTYVRQILDEARKNAS